MTMEVSQRIAELVARLPPGLKQLLDAELAAGNNIIDMEIGPGDAEGRATLVLKHPFRTDVASPPASVFYREIKDNEPLIYEYYTADEKLSLMTAVFKPMVFQPLGGPENPTEAHIERMEEIAKRAADAAAKAAEEMNKPPEPVGDPNPGDAANRFLESMKMTFDMWHDGTGYDLDALKRLTPPERNSIEKLLVSRHPRDWRDIEALAHIDTPTARSLLESALKSADPKVRREAMRCAGEKAIPADREKLVIHAIRTKGLYDGLSEVIDEIPDFHPPAVIDALFHGALTGNGEAAVHFAALLFYLHGKAKEPFDWEHRPFFLRFNTSDRNERRAAFRELCATVGVEVGKYMR
jgi:hypothetical protein